MSDDSAAAAGQWKVTIHGPTGPQETLLELALQDGQLGGTQSALGQVQPVIDIAFDAGTGAISWVNKIKSPLPLTLKFAGTIEGRNMSGKVNAAIMGAFPFTAVKA